MMTQVMLVAFLAIVIGVAIGAALPFIVGAVFDRLLPFPLAPDVYPGEVGAGFLYGGLTALAFSLGPLGRAHDIPVSALFRDRIEPDRRRPRRRYIAMIVGVAAALIATILLLAGDRRLALMYMGATLASFALLRGVAALLMAGARRLPHARNVALRLAIANIHRPGALTPSVVLSLGLGLALLVALSLIDGNIRNQLDHMMPGATPSFFFIDIRSGQADAFRDFLHTEAPDGKTTFVPMMRGRIVKVKDRAASEVKAADKAAWVLRGDRGITFSARVPDGSTLDAGTWWPTDYAGPPLVSLETEIAAGLGLAVGDDITVNVLGRNLTARVANTRKVNWRTFGLNFVLVFSPNTFAGAPHSDLATLTFPKGGDAPREIALLRAAAKAFPTVTSVRVKDALDAVSLVVGQLAVAVRGASSVALIASILVLGGALAAGQQARLYDAVVLKTLGATRGRLLGAFLLEFGLLGLCTAVFGVLAGGAAAFVVVSRVMELQFVWLWPRALIVAAAALAITILLGLAGTWRILGRKPAPYLRNL